MSTQHHHCNDCGKHHQHHCSCGCKSGGFNHHCGCQQCVNKQVGHSGQFGFQHSLHGRFGHCGCQQGMHGRFGHCGCQQGMHGRFGHCGCHQGMHGRFGHCDCHQGMHGRFDHHCLCDDRFRVRLSGLRSSMAFRLRQLIGCKVKFVLEEDKVVIGEINAVGGDFVEVVAIVKKEKNKPVCKKKFFIIQFDKIIYMAKVKED